MAWVRSGDMARFGDAIVGPLGVRAGIEYGKRHLHAWVEIYQPTEEI